MQAEPENSFLKIQLRASLHMDSRNAQTSAALIQFYSGHEIMLPILTWAPLTSNHTAQGRSGGCVISVQMVACTAGKHVSIAGAMAQAVISAAATKCACTTPWLPRLLWLQLSGILRQMRAHLTVWWHKAVSVLAGSVERVAISGVQGLVHESAKELVARTAPTMQGENQRSVTQPLQGATTLFWQSGITSAMQRRGSFLTK